MPLSQLLRLLFLELAMCGLQRDDSRWITRNDGRRKQQPCSLLERQRLQLTHSWTAFV